MSTWNLVVSMLVTIVVIDASIEPLPTPPMGYSTWQWNPGSHWGTKMGQYNAVNESVCMTQADAMVSKGLVAKGYTVFVVDEPCFAGRNNQTGELMPNSTTWPNGFAGFAKYLNARGMVLGMYTDAGTFTCQGCPGSAGHEERDMQTFMDWGVSYVKVDRCFGVDNDAMREDLPQTFAKYRTAANAVSPSRRIQISAILAATDNCWEWCNGTCDHCRTTGDITNSFGAMQGHVNEQSAIPFIETFAGKGYFNDLDMLIVGNMSGKFYGGPGLNSNETKAHIALWAVLKSPLLLSCDINSLTPFQLDLLTNDEMLAIYNDPLAVQATRIRTTTGNAVPSRLSFGPCPPGSAAPLSRQLWDVDSGSITNKASGRVLDLNSCGSRVGLCGQTASPPEPVTCMNTSCPSSKTWSWSSSSPTGTLGSIKNHYNNDCLEGMLGPQESFLQTSKCDATNVKQMWTHHEDETLRAFGQCLTAEAMPTAPASTVDTFVGRLSNGDVTIVMFNSQATTVAGTISVSDLGWSASTTATVRDIWSKKTLPSLKTQGQYDVSAHGVVFLRLSPVTM